MYRRNRNQGRDPYWLEARYPGRCAKCGQSFGIGEQIFYYPLGRKAYVGGCAEDASADFRGHAVDEDIFPNMSL